jgi:hypothetical protein
MGYYVSAHWRDGAQVWQVRSDSGNDLEVEGQPPASYEERRARLLAQLEDADSEEEAVDYAGDIPVDLAEELTGFRHDSGLDDLPWPVGDVLERDLPPAPSMQTTAKKPWWKLW